MNGNKTIVKMEVFNERSEDVPPKLWDSLESDTESLAQEKAFQRELQKCILEAGEKSPFGTKPHSFHVNVDIESSQHENSRDLETSREQTLAAARPTVTGKHEIRSNKLPRQSPPGDEYADLRYDPDWRRNLPEADLLCKVQRNLSLDSSPEAEDDTAREKRDYVVVSNTVEVDIVHPGLPSFHLHPPQGRCSHGDIQLSLPQSFCSSPESTPRFHSARASEVGRGDHQSAADVLPCSLAQQRQGKETNRRRDGEEQSTAADRLNSIAPQLRKARPVRLLVDIVERNKATLGVKGHKEGSYLKTYGQKAWRAGDAYQSPEPTMDTVSTDIQESPDNALDPELMWIQKTQKLKIHKESKCPDRPRLQNPRPGPGVHVLHPVERQSSGEGQRAPAPAENWVHAQPDLASISHLPRHQPFPGTPTIHLNFNANVSPAKLGEPFLSGQLHEQVFPLAPHPLSQWQDRRDGQTLPSISPFGHAVGLMGLAPQVSLTCPALGNHHIGRTHLQNTDRKLDGKPALTDGMAAINNNSTRATPTWPGTSDASAAAVMPFGEESVHCDYALPPYKGAYTVLPPIVTSDSGLHNAGTEPTLNALPRSNSEGYLAQLEKHRQLKPQTTYKVYTLKDYRSLNQEVKLGGLGPSCTVTEKTAEKIKRQKLYSNVIREQNKKISTVPFLQDRNPLGSENKGAVPRNKALEYAKTIVKPRAPQQWKEKSKEKHEKERVLEHAAVLQLGLDLSQLAAIDILRKRHEEEKQAVARITSIHASSSAPSVNTR